MFHLTNIHQLSDCLLYLRSLAWRQCDIYCLGTLLWLFSHPWESIFRKSLEQRKQSHIESLFDNNSFIWLGLFQGWRYGSSIFIRFKHASIWLVWPFNLRHSPLCRRSLYYWSHNCFIPPQILLYKLCGHSPDKYKIICSKHVIATPVHSDAVFWSQKPIHLF